MQRKFPSLAPLLNALNAGGIGSSMICIYYLNEGLSVLQTNPLLTPLFSWLFQTDGVWSHHTAWLDATNLAGATAALLVLFRVAPMKGAYVMMADTLADSYVLLYRIFWQWMYGRGLYVNELMAKKFSLLGCVAMMIASQHQESRRAGAGGGGGGGGGRRRRRGRQEARGEGRRSGRGWGRRGMNGWRGEGESGVLSGRDGKEWGLVGGVEGDERGRLSFLNDIPSCACLAGQDALARLLGATARGQHSLQEPLPRSPRRSTAHCGLVPLRGAS